MERLPVFKLLESELDVREESLVGTARFPGKLVPHRLSLVSFLLQGYFLLCRTLVPEVLDHLSDPSILLIKDDVAHACLSLEEGLQLVL